MPSLHSSVPELELCREHAILIKGRIAKNRTWGYTSRRDHEAMKTIILPLKPRSEEVGGCVRSQRRQAHNSLPPFHLTRPQLPLPPDHTSSLCPALEASMSYHHNPYSRPSSPASAPPIPTTPASAKADQIVYRLFNKLVLVVADARTTASSHPTTLQNLYDTDDARAPNRDSASATALTSKRDRTVPKQPKIDKWVRPSSRIPSNFPGADDKRFNLETPDLENYKPTLATYKSISTTHPAPTTPPLHISVLLSVPVPGSHGNSGTHHGPNPAKALVHQFLPLNEVSPAMRVTHVTPPPRYILLETHTLTLNPTSMGSSSVELPQVYKQAISLFRSLYTLLRVLPAWKMHRKLRRRGQPGAGSLALEVQVSVGKPLAVDDDLVAGFDAPLSQPPESLTTESISFPLIPTPLGAFAVRTMYRLHPYYALESLESLLSTHFLSPSPSVSERPRRDDASALREPVQFTPTLTSALQRQRQQSLSSPRLPLPVAPPERSRPFPIRSDIELASTRPGSSPLNSLPIRTSLPHSPSSQGSGSAPTSAPIRNLHSSNSSASSSSRPRRLSALHPCFLTFSFFGPRFPPFAYTATR
ncbi:hypothetical protein BS47DRAFT_1398909 [Hydnum rufescens UP504]|uniref:Autophagy-related protein 13 n=1 Tax=Hydnum rufescens UP504 TaxID=1448309 RepID=A0A9P6AKT7_9AGAM|nr:hypothetical protein BS47DRAFT_1398909 [Hydnum rufescens UP504]